MAFEPRYTRNISSHIMFDLVGEPLVELVMKDFKIQLSSSEAMDLAMAILSHVRLIETRPSK